MDSIFLTITPPYSIVVSIVMLACCYSVIITCEKTVCKNKGDTCVVIGDRGMTTFWLWIIASIAQWVTPFVSTVFWIFFAKEFPVLTTGVSDSNFWIFVSFVLFKAVFYLIIISPSYFIIKRHIFDEANRLKVYLSYMCSMTLIIMIADFLTGIV